MAAHIFGLSNIQQLQNCWRNIGQNTIGAQMGLGQVVLLVGEAGIDLRFHGTMRFPGGVVAQFDCGMVMPGRDELEAIGTEGSLFLDDPWHCHTPLIEVRRDDGIERIALDPVDSYRLELENLSDAIRGEAPLLLGREDAVPQARALEALHRSAETITPVVV